MARTRNWLDDDYPVLTGQTVHEQHREDWTGLLDHTGTPLYRNPNPLGFDMAKKPSAPMKPSKKPGKGKGC